MSLQDRFPYRDATYRRRIRITPGPGVVDGEMDDYMHHFTVHIEHDGTHVTAASANGVRTPWETCGIGAAGIAGLAGTRLDDGADLSRWPVPRSSGCLHVGDLGALACAHALTGTAVHYDIAVTPAMAPLRTLILTRDGVERFRWQLEAQTVRAPERYVGLSLERNAFRAWIAQHLDGDGQEDEQEEATVARRAAHISYGRGLELDDYEVAANANTVDDSCYTFRTEVAWSARRNRGASRPTEQEQEQERH